MSSRSVASALRAPRARSRRLLAVLGVLATAGLLSSLLLVATVVLAFVAAHLNARFDLDARPVPPLRVPVSWTTILFASVLPWVAVARAGVRIPTRTPTRWAAVGPLTVVALVWGGVGVRWGLLGLVIAGLLVATVGPPVGWVFVRFFLPRLDDAAYASSLDPATSDHAERRLAARALLVGALPLVFLPLSDAAGNGGLWLGAALPLMPALLAITLSRGSPSPPGCPGWNSPTRARRVWEDVTAVGRRPAASFSPTPWPARLVALAGSLAAGAAAWPPPEVVGPARMLPALGVAGLVGVWSRSSLGRRRVGVLAVLPVLAVLALVAAALPGLWTGACGRLGIVLVGLAGSAAWVSRGGESGRSLDGDDRTTLAGASWIGAVALLSYVVWASNEARGAAIVTLVACALAVLGGGKAWMRIEHRRLVGRLALGGHLEGVRARRGDCGVRVTFEGSGEGYRDARQEHDVPDVWRGSAHDR